MRPRHCRILEKGYTPDLLKLNALLVDGKTMNYLALLSYLVAKSVSSGCGNAREGALDKFPWKAYFKISRSQFFMR